MDAHLVDSLLTSWRWQEYKQSGAGLPMTSGGPGHCFYSTQGGYHWVIDTNMPGGYKNHTWAGMRHAIEGERIGMLLDLHRGSKGRCSGKG